MVWLIPMQQHDQVCYVLLSPWSSTVFVKFYFLFITLAWERSAQCSMLFAFHFISALPLLVWNSKKGQVRLLMIKYGDILLSPRSSTLCVKFNPFFVMLGSSVAVNIRFRFQLHGNYFHQNHCNIAIASCQTIRGLGRLQKSRVLRLIVYHNAGDIGQTGKNGFWPQLPIHQC